VTSSRFNRSSNRPLGRVIGDTRAVPVEVSWFAPSCRGDSSPVRGGEFDPPRLERVAKLVLARLEPGYLA
jgi:hypothetical protein